MAEPKEESKSDPNAKENEEEDEINPDLEQLVGQTEFDKYKDRQENDVRIAVIGNVDSGKSTLVGCMTKCVRDDGRGLARKMVFNFSHEAANGRTSSIG